MNIKKNKNFIIPIALFISCLTYFYLPSSVSAASISVSGSCSYNDAISSANTNVSVGGCVSGDPGLDSVILPSGVTTLSGNPVEYTESISFQGNADGTSKLNSAHSASYAISNHTTTLPNVDLTVNDITFNGFGLNDGSSKTVVIGHGSTTGNAEISGVNFTDTWIYPGANLGAYSYSSAFQSYTTDTINISSVRIIGTTLGQTQFFPLTGINSSSQVTIKNFTFDGLVSDLASQINASRDVYSVFFTSTNIDLQDIDIVNIDLRDNTREVFFTGVYITSQENSNVQRLRIHDNDVSDPIGNLISGSGLFNLIVSSKNASISDIDISNNTYTSGVNNEEFRMIGLYTEVDNDHSSVINNYSFTHNTFNDISPSPTTTLFPSAILLEAKNSGMVTVRNSTISDNNGLGAVVVKHDGQDSSTASVSIINSTISDNQMYSPRLPTDLSSIYIKSSSATDYDHILNIQNTILSNNTRQSSEANCGVGSVLTSLGSNLSSDGTCTSALSQSSDIHDTDPILEPLSIPSGSFGPMRLLTAASPAIDKAATVTNITVDQRGTSRPQGAAYDIGAHEYVNSNIIAVPINPPNAPNTGGLKSIDSKASIIIIPSVIALFMIIKRFRYRKPN